MISQSESFALFFVMRFFLIVRFEESIVLIAFGRCMFITLWGLFWRFFYFLWRLIVGVKDSGYFVNYGGYVGPSIRFFFGVDELTCESDFERTDLRVHDILVGIRIDVLIFCDFEGNQMIR